MTKKIRVSLTQAQISHVIELSGNNKEVSKYFNGIIDSIKIRKEKKKFRIATKGIDKEDDLRKAAEKFRKDLIKNQTKEEKLFQKYLKDLEIDFQFQKIFYNRSSFYIVDFFIQKYKYVIELDGLYHYNTQNKKNDRKRTSVLLSSGINRVIRIPNFIVENEERCKLKIKGVLYNEFPEVEINKEKEEKLSAIEFMKHMDSFDQLLQKAKSNNHKTFSAVAEFYKKHKSIHSKMVTYIAKKLNLYEDAILFFIEEKLQKEPMHLLKLES